MTTTKQLLERTIQKVCGLADCVSKYTASLPAPTSDYQEYIPPKDGYIFLSLIPSTNGTYFAVRPNADTANNCIFSSVNVSPGLYASNAYRVWKGKTCRYKHSDPNATSAGASFWESIGGGV